MSNANQLPFLNLMEILFNFFVFLHTYIRNWSLQPFSQDSDLASHTTYVVCVNFIHEWRDLHFNVDSERQIFEKLFHGRFIYSYFYTTFVVCVNFIYEWRDLLFKVDSERHIFLRNFSLQFYLLLKLLLEICGRKSPKKYFSYFVLMSGLGLEPWLSV